MHKSLPIIAIIGATGVGKTSFSYTLAQLLNNKAIIINADMAQLYSGLSIGTAKPDVLNTPLRHYLFSYCTHPTSYNVADYRKNLESIIHKEHDYPIIVGGSTLYVHSLFFDYCAPSFIEPVFIERIRAMSNQQLWSELAVLDSVRAAQIHCNDRYRLQRALMISQGGKKASLQKPAFKPLAPSVIIHLTLDTSLLKTQLANRIKDMFENGWMQEVESLLGTEWQEFWDRKKIIGYTSIASFITKQSHISFEQLQEDILCQTMQYVKKQNKYWRMLKRCIATHDPSAHRVIYHTFDTASSEQPLYLKEILQSIMLLQKEIA